jgi:hypothetical protein
VAHKPTLLISQSPQKSHLRTEEGCPHTVRYTEGTVIYFLDAVTSGPLGLGFQVPTDARSLLCSKMQWSSGGHFRVSPVHIVRRSLNPAGQSAVPATQSPSQKVLTTDLLCPMDRTVHGAGQSQCVHTQTSNAVLHFEDPKDLHGWPLPCLPTLSPTPSLKSSQSSMSQVCQIGQLVAAAPSAGLCVPWATLLLPLTLLSRSHPFPRTNPSNPV